MLRLIDVLSRDVQDQFLGCLSRKGIPRRVGRILRLLEQHLPELADESESERVFTMLRRLWRDRRRQLVRDIAASN